MVRLVGVQCGWIFSGKEKVSEEQAGLQNELEYKQMVL